MGDTKALQKQLDIKNAQILELTTEVSQKENEVYGLEEKLKEQERGQFYLEQCIESKARDLKGLQKLNDEVSATASAAGFGDAIDKNQAAIDDKEAELQKIEDEISGIKQVMKRHAHLTSKYQNLKQQIDAGTLDPNQLVDVLQTDLQATKDGTAANKQEIANLKEAEVEIHQQQADLQAQIPVSYTHLTLPTKRIV
eukprot:TRINITY_DN24975_c0_g1_i2.p1 TRINITY_DN24975_c0_g1~~TRINITY_DN24975_c0_g1_i2.p1  ORF type:complete len:197 (+),score=73.17 TRINITY_DN24975_c0_g1_i2:222-812(+)